MIDSSDTTMPPDAGSLEVVHPLWCGTPEGEAASRCLTPDGKSVYRLGQGERDQVHLGRAVRLDAGETYAWSLSVGPSQWFDVDFPHERSALRGRLVIRQNEAAGAEDAEAFLSADELRAFARMLECVAGQVDRYEDHQTRYDLNQRAAGSG
ncbi:MAG TPA: hypothetical protein VFR07_12975 [Mycobacteriales bacterium]|jgi:hypothetical protein|nr:hypothetical protein [Mycobacteriales bacterium]